MFLLFLIGVLVLAALDFCFYYPKRVRLMSDEEFLAYFKRSVMGMPDGKSNVRPR